MWWTVYAGLSSNHQLVLAVLDISKATCGINALNYYFPTILTVNIGQTELMARILTECNATSYMISSGLCFWMIERFGRRSLMLSGLWLQFFAYLMVAISVALLSHAPLPVRGVSQPFALDDHLTIHMLYSGEPSRSLPYSSTMLPLAAHGKCCPGCTKLKSIH